jgi:short-subunit dehydrogenase
MKQKQVLITGASSGIGLELSHVFAEKGYALVLVARRKDKLDALAKDLQTKHGSTVHVIDQDLMVSDAANKLVKRLDEDSLDIDVLVNNAGRGHYSSFIEGAVETDEATLQLNVVTLTSLTKIFAQRMVKMGRGYILNIASIAGFLSGPKMAVYNASKAYVLSLSEAVNYELKGTGVSVTASCPGPTESEFMQHSGADQLTNLKYAHFMTARAVAEQAVEATLKRKPVIVHGAINKAIITIPRLLPRKVTTSMIARSMK